MENLRHASRLLAVPIAVLTLVAPAWGAEPPGAAKAAASALQVKLDVLPKPTTLADFLRPWEVAPFSDSPMVGDGTQITLTATLPQSVMKAVPYPLYRFTAVLSPSGQTFVIKNVTKSNE